ncbi:MAG: biosynthetic arginine decarboxylase [Candidatus Caenarcaniphilales bacterium]|nr:biosynthetic arginine decarboxylase [Candidatus Caenarcaniphilales bacterium]
MTKFSAKIDILGTNSNQRQNFTRWSIKASDQLYRISQWGENFFEINDLGHLCLKDKTNKAQLDLYQFAVRHGSSPLLLRFPDVLKTKLIEQIKAFEAAIDHYDYQGAYIPAYPTKSNQARDILQDVLDANPDNPYILEVGSKSELAQAILMSASGQRLICGGYKDKAYFELALMASKLDLEVFVVLESLAELDFLLSLDDLTDLKFGLRLKLSSEGQGHWAGSIGNRSKFGMGSSQILLAFDKLKAEGLVQQLKLLHYHPGSQISSLDGFSEPLIEAVRVYQDLIHLGAPLTTIDLGGGAAIDYQGQDDQSEFSANYSLYDYADLLIKTLKKLFADTDLAEPDLITENGKAVLAHASMIVVPLLTSDHPSEFPAEPPQANDPALIKQLFEDLDNLNPDNLSEPLAELRPLGKSIVKSFRQAKLDLRQKAKAESLYWALAHKVYQACLEAGNFFKSPHFQWLEGQLATVYLANFSLFRSLPDFWAIGQLFPIIPLNQLDQEPLVRAHLADLTCDSDGMIKTFLAQGGIMPYLPLHPLSAQEPYFVGIFLTGAYQEILGNAHNLFGELPLYEITYHEGGFQSKLASKPTGSSLSDMLKTMLLSQEYIESRLKNHLDHLQADDSARLRERIEKLLSSSTYLCSDDFRV